jgi:hypothetical protein
MRIPEKHNEREFFYLDLINKCKVSLDDRRSDYASYRSWYLFGASPEDSPAAYNKIYSHIDQLVSFLYSSETTRFNIALGAAVHPGEHTKIPALGQLLHDEWNNSNADKVFTEALTWSLCYGSCFVKLVVREKSIYPYVLDPGSVGVLREDVSTLDRQQALTHTYYMTKSDLFDRLYSHPRRDSIVERVTASQYTPSIIPEGIQRLVTSQVNPVMYGNVNLNLSAPNRFRAKVGEDTIEMTDLYIWNDEIKDYQIVTRAAPDVIIYDRPLEQMFLRGELPIIQICPTPQYDYFWGQPEVQKLVVLQDMRNRRMSEILDLLSKQVSPPTALTGFSGIIDEKDFALNRAGGLFMSDMPTTKVEKLAPNIPQDLYAQLKEIDSMFEEASGISNVLSGRGESGVRSAGHASQLARLGSSRAKKRALMVEDSLEKMATLYLKLLQAYNDTHLTDTNEVKFIPEQFTRDYVVKVDAHSNSPIFMEDLRQLAFNLFKAQAIDKESLIDLLDPPMKQLLKDRLKKMESKAAAQPPEQKQPSKPKAVA